MAILTLQDISTIGGIRNFFFRNSPSGILLLRLPHRIAWEIPLLVSSNLFERIESIDACLRSRGQVGFSGKFRSNYQFWFPSPKPQWKPKIPRVQVLSAYHRLGNIQDSLSSAWDKNKVCYDVALLFGRLVRHCGSRFSNLLLLLLRIRLLAGGLVLAWVAWRHCASICLLQARTLALQELHQYIPSHTQPGCF